jgi:hypothetical protein
MGDVEQRTSSADTEEARDVLAAEAFAMPAADPSLHHGPVVLPDDPTGIEEPHDVLAAEEFAMPAVPGYRSSAALAYRSATPLARSLAPAAGLLMLALLFRLLRRR